MFIRSTTAGIGLFCLAAASTPASAETLTTNYAVALIGLPVGRASFETTVDGDSYSVTGSLSSAGLADLFAETSGTSSAAGRIGADGLIPAHYALSYETDGESWASDVTFQSGSVASSEVSPKRDEEDEDYVPVTEAQLRGVFDPLSGLMIPAKGDARSVCARTIPIYDGWSRLDLRLSYARMDEIATDGYSGEAVVCNLRVVPVGGFETDSDGLDFIREQTIEMWFAPVARSGLWGPVHVRIPTTIGPLTLTATTFAKE